MSDEQQPHEKQPTKKVFYWDEERPNIGVCITLRNGKRGEFFTFEPIRSYRQKQDGQLKVRYTNSFTEEQAEAFGNVIVWALGYIRANSPLPAPEQSNGASATKLQAAA